MSSKSVDRREKILQIAAEMFAEHGYLQTTTKALAAKAHVAEGLIFHHFGNKIGLLRALARERRPETMAVGLIHAQTLPLHEIPAFLANAWGEDSSDARLLATLARDAAGDDALREFVAEIAGGVRAGIRTFLQGRIATGQLRADLDIDVFADILQQVLVGRTLMTTVLPPTASLTTQLTFLFDTLRR